MTKKLQLTKGLYTLLDKADFDNVSAFSWCANRKTSGKIHYEYAVRNIYPESSYKPKLVYLHRYIFGEIPKGMVVDHINGDTLDNRRRNLRITTRAVNRSNNLHSRL